MNTGLYVKKILKLVKAPKSIKQRLQEDLTQDIEARIAGGQTLGEVMAEMGEPYAVAAGIQAEYPVRPKSFGETFLLAIAAISGFLCAYNLIALLEMAALQWTYGLQIPDSTPGAMSSIGIIGGADGPTAIYTTVFAPPAWLLAAVGLGVAALCVAGYRLLRGRKK